MKSGTLSLKVFILMWATLIFSRSTLAGEKIGKETSLYKVLVSLGMEAANYELPNVNQKMIEQGRKIVVDGVLPREGSPRQSEFFKCIDCHSVTKESENLMDSSPEVKQEYASTHNTTWAPGSTLKGLVNRSSYYNDEYREKYGSLLSDLEDGDLKGAIQICATACSQGTELNSEEMDAVLAYLWSLELNLGDLDLNKQDYLDLNNPDKTENDKEKLIQHLKTKFPQKERAHFVSYRKSYKKVKRAKGNIQSGEQVWKHSCLNCHGADHMDDYGNKFSAKSLQDMPAKILTRMIRKGSDQLSEDKWLYMPAYSKEKITDQQIKDLYEYIQSL